MQITDTSLLDDFGWLCHILLSVGVKVVRFAHFIFVYDISDFVPWQSHQMLILEALLVEHMQHPEESFFLSDLFLRLSPMQVDLKTIGVGHIVNTTCIVQDIPSLRLCHLRHHLLSLLIFLGFFAELIIELYLTQFDFELE